MQSGKDATLQLIQREISEVVQREKELKELYLQLENNGISKPKQSSKLTNGIESSTRNSRLFTQNPSSKGAMHRFIKSRVRASSNVFPTESQKAKPTAWNTRDNIELERPIIPVGIQPRNGFVSIEERLRKEFVEMEVRESELVMQRTKSQPNLFALLNSQSPEPAIIPLQSARSVSQLSDSTYDSSLCSPSSSLKPARSLADLCDVDEEDAPPGSVNLIKRWEGIIQKNQS